MLLGGQERVFEWLWDGPNTSPNEDDLGGDVETSPEQPESPAGVGLHESSMFKTSGAERIRCSKTSCSIPAPSNRSPPATFKSAKATRGDLLEGLVEKSL